MPRNTLGDDLAEVAKMQVHPDRSPRHNSKVVAPCCGRQTLADCIQDFRNAPRVSADFLCDGCRGRWHRDPDKPWSRASLIQAAGGDWSEVRPHMVKEKVHDLQRNANGRYRTDQIRAQAETAVPDVERDIRPPQQSP